MIYDACNIMGLPSETFDQVRGDSDSIAGLMLEMAGEIPKVNDVFTVGDFEFVIMEVDRNRIKKVKVLIKPQVA
jgi:CBS domain containing-hemolysin-like protein